MKKACENAMKAEFPSLSQNEALARSLIAAFIMQLNPTVAELADIKCAVSEAVTNAIVHAYRDTVGLIYITVKIMNENEVRIEIRDRGCGIPDVKQAREPLYTTDAESERSGLGFTVMESFCDKLRVRSKVGHGTTVILTKKIGARELDL